jgi:hypothetical protein
MQTHIKKSFYFFLIAFGLLNLLSFTLLLGTISFLFGQTISFWQFPLAFVLALLINFLAARSFEKKDLLPSFFRSSLAILAVIFFSIWLAVYFYDVSFDGQSYHMEAVYQLGTHWNPVARELPDSINLTEAIYVNHYPKGSEIPQSAIYHITNKIESGKGTNFIVLTACFFLCLSLLYRLNRFTFWKKIWISALFTLNPVTVGELISFYVDGQMAMLLLCYLLICYFVLTEDKWFYLLLQASLLVILINLKFTGVLFAGIFTLGFLLILLANKKNALFRKVLLAGAIAGVVGVGWAGFYPYITNSMHDGNPFYPVMGPAKKDIISNVYPESFKDKNRFGKFFVSFFAHTDELKIYEDKNPKVPSKIPFSFNMTDIKNAPKLGVKMAGFGPFFSGAFLISLVLFVMLARGARDQSWVVNASILLGTILVSVFAVPEAWWARLVPQLWLFPLLIAFFSEPDQTRLLKWFRGIIYCSLAVNILLASLILPWNLIKTEEVKYQVNQLKASKDTLSVEFSYFKSNRIRLRENGIPYKERAVGDQNIDYLVHSSTKFIEPANLPSPPRPFLLSLGEAIKRKLKR